MKCENCNKEHNGSYGSGRFCSLHCRKSYIAKKVKNRQCGYAIHAKNKKRQQYKTWKCNRCDCMFYTKHELYDHIHKIHNVPTYGPHGKGQPIWNKGHTLKDDDRLYYAGQKLKEGYKNGRLHASRKGKKHSEDTKRKLRIYFCNWLESLPANKPKVNYNPKSINFFNNLSKEKGWNLQHAENGGEFYTGIGYFVDAYDKEKNIVVEYDEKNHYVDVKNNILHEKDIKRQTEIINHLHCEFWRYNEVMDILWKVN